MYIIILEILDLCVRSIMFIVVGVIILMLHKRDYLHYIKFDIIRNFDL